MVTYESRLKVLRSYGFASFEEYERCPLWQTVKNIILRRDAMHCRAYRCRNKATIIGRLANNEYSLIGRTPETLVSLCPECAAKLPTDTLDNNQKRTLELVIGCPMIPGKSNPKAGRFFKDAKMSNRDTLREIQTAFSLQEK